MGHARHERPQSGHSTILACTGGGSHKHTLASRFSCAKNTRNCRSRSVSLRHSTALTAAAVAGAIAAPSIALALPQDGNVVEGQAEIIYGSNSVEIVQGSDRVIIEWSSFDVGVDESVNFVQPSQLASALNRVLSGQSSAILGSLTGNGQITIVNPAGIHFGATANVDVAAITATTIDIINANFMANNLAFDQFNDDFANATVTNDGSITVQDSGLAALVAPGVANNGIIAARTGAVVLASGTAFTVDPYGDGLIQFAVNAPTTEAPEGMDALVSNSGEIYADGGTVILTAEAVSGIVDNVVNMDGVIQAQTIEGRNGQIALVGGDGAGAVNVAGTLDASGNDAGEAGGTVHVLGDQVALNVGANVDVSGAAGGGEALIGGAYQGGAQAAGAALQYQQTASGLNIISDTAFETDGYTPTSDITYFDADATANASATVDGDGGNVIVWGDTATGFFGAVSAQGGASGGDGGFVEVSGASYLDFSGTVDTSAVAGATGDLLLDPVTMLIILGRGDGEADDDTSNLSWLDSGENDFDALTSSITESEIETQNTNFTIRATRFVRVEDGGTVTGSFGDGVVQLQNNRSLTIETRGMAGDGNGEIDLTGSATFGADLIFRTTGSGSITILGSEDGSRVSNIVLSRLETENGDISVTTNIGNITAENDLTVTGTGGITLQANDVLTIDLGALVTTQGGTVSFTAGDRIVVDAPLTLTGDTTLTSTGAGNVTFNSTIDGTFNLTVNTAGVTLFDGNIGGTTRVGDITTDAAGSTTLQTLTLQTLGNLTFNDPVTGSGGLIITANQSAGTTTFASTVDGGDWIINEPTALTFGGAVGATTALTNLQIISTGGAVNINGGSVRVNNLLRLRGNLVFDSPTNTTTLQSVNNNEILLGHSPFNTIRSATDGEESLIINTTGTTRINGVVGDNNQRFDAITTNDGGTTVLTGGALNLAGNTLTFNDAVTLGADTVITDAGAVTFNNTIDGAFGLTVNAGGNITFGNDATDLVGGTTALTSLSATSTGGQVNVNSAITTNNGAITINADLIDLAAALNAGTGIATLAPGTAGQTISLGTTVAGSLSLLDTGIDLVTAGILRIGSATAGSITFNSAISPLNATTLSLITGDAIVDGNAGLDVTVSNLAMQAVNGIADRTGNPIIETNVDTVAARNTTDGSINIVEQSGGGNLTIGTVDGVVGIRNEVTAGARRSTQIETNNGDLIVNADIFNSRGNTFIVAQHVGNGDRLFDNNAAISNSDRQIEIRANNMSLEGGTINAGSNRVIVRPELAGVAINLGGADAAGVLGLTDAEIDTITTTGVLQIGHASSGAITFSGGITPANVDTVALQTGAQVINDMADINIAVTNLAIRSGMGIGVTPGSVSNRAMFFDVSNIAFENADDLVSFNSFSDLTIAEVDGLTESTNTLFNTNINAPSITFATDLTTGLTGRFTAPVINVNNGVEVSSTSGALSFQNVSGNLTINLDGNLTAPGGISGNGTIINVLSDTGGAEIQDAVDVARSNATAANPVTIDVAVGTYDSFVVDKEFITVSGAGSDFDDTVGTVVLTGTPAITIVASNTTIQNMALTASGLPDIGIAINGDPAVQTDPTDPATTGVADLTGIEIINVDFSNLTFGVLTIGDIGDGTAAVDVTVRGNSSADKAVFEDMTQVAIAVGDTDSDAVYLIKDLILQDGSDADDLSAGIDGIALGAIAAATIQGVNMTHAADFDGIFVGPTLTNATILIGGPTSEDANTIRGLSDGIDTSTISGGSFIVQGNDLIFGDDDAFDVNGQIIDSANVQVLDNTSILGNEDGLDFGAILGSTVTVSGNQSIMATDPTTGSDAIEFGGEIGLGSTVNVTNNVNIVGFEEGLDIFDLTGGTFTVANNTLIQGQTQNGIEFEGFIFGTAQVVVRDNTDILGDIFGIEFQEEILGATSVTIDGNGTALHVGAAYDGSQQVDLAQFVTVGRIQNGIAFTAISGDAAVTVSRNIISGGNDTGVDFAGSIDTTSTTAIHNNFILGHGGHGVSFTSNIASTVEVFQNFIAGNGGNGVNVGRGSIGTDLLLVQQNFLPGAGFANGNGGFAFSHIGTGTPDIEGNWWGTPFAVFLPAVFNGVSIPAQVLATGQDTNIEATLGVTTFDPFAFQNQFLVAPQPLPPEPPFDFNAIALSLEFPEQTDPALAPGDRESGRAATDAINDFNDVYGLSFGLAETGDLAGLTPAAGGTPCALSVENGTPTISCGSGGGLEGLSPAAGGPGGGDGDFGQFLQDFLNGNTFGGGITWPG